MMQPEFLSAQRIAKILDVSEDAALAIINRLPNVKVGSVGSKKPRKRVRHEVFYAWLAQQDGYGQIRNPLRVVRGGGE